MRFRSQKKGTVFLGKILLLPLLLLVPGSKINASSVGNPNASPFANHVKYSSHSSLLMGRLFGERIYPNGNFHDRPSLIPTAVTHRRTNVLFLEFIVRSVDLLSTQSRRHS